MPKNVHGIWIVTKHTSQTLYRKYHFGNDSLKVAPQSKLLTVLTNNIFKSATRKESP